MNKQEIAEFERSLGHILETARTFELDFFPMRYEICPAEVLYSLGAYGMPTRFSHWSFGKAYHRMKTQYDYNLSRIYELVINSNPCYAFLLEGNSVLQNKVIAAHVLGHSDFFKHNQRFSHTSRQMVETMASSAERIREYEFRYGRQRVEEFLDACLALQYHVDPYIVRHPPPRRPPTPQSSLPREFGSSFQPSSTAYDDLWDLDRFPSHRSGTSERASPGTGRNGNQPRSEHLRSPIAENLEEGSPAATDLLLFLLEQSHVLEPWERDILSVLREETLYFYPQLETKIMNEGWASLWHARIMREIDLSEEEVIEFAKMHANVLQPSRMSLNPYRVGYEIFLDIERSSGRNAIFEVRECESDVSFLRNHLTEDLVEELDLYLYEQIDGNWVVVEKGWEVIRDQLVRQASHAGIPVIVAADSDFKGNGELLLVHRYEDEELDQRYVDKTLPYVYRLWGRAVHLETAIDGKAVLVSYDGHKVSRRGGRGRASS